MSCDHHAMTVVAAREHSAVAMPKRSAISAVIGSVLAVPRIPAVLQIFASHGDATFSEMSKTIVAVAAERLTCHTCRLFSN